MFRKIISFIIVSILIIFFIAGCQSNQITQREKEPPNVPTKFTEGEYTGYSNATDTGYAWAKVIIKNENVTDVELMEITSKGLEKDYDTYNYEPSVKARDEMAKRFEEADSSEVDVYSGATDSSKKFRQAVSRALSYARQKKEGKYFSGTFQGKSDKSDYGHAVALVTIENDKIKDVQLKELTKDNKWKDFSNYDYKPAVKANKEMPARFIEANSHKVDTYSEATQSSQKYQAAVRRALMHARKDPNEIVGNIIN